MKILIIILFTLQPFLTNEASALFELKGTGSRFSACSYIKMLFFCWDMLYRLWKQYDHVIMLAKNQSAYSSRQTLDQRMCK